MAFTILKIPPRAVGVNKGGPFLPRSVLLAVLVVDLIPVRMDNSRTLLPRPVVLILIVVDLEPV
jgi:hypothetical protein